MFYLVLAIVLSLLGIWYGPMIADYPGKLMLHLPPYWIEMRLIAVVALLFVSLIALYFIVWLLKKPFEGLSFFQTRLAARKQRKWLQAFLEGLSFQLWQTHEKADKKYKYLAKLNDSQSIAYHLQTTNLIEAHKAKEAVERLKKALKIYSKNVDMTRDLTLQLVRALLAAKEPEAALEALTPLIAAAGNKPAILQLQASCYAALKKYDRLKVILPLLKKLALKPDQKAHWHDLAATTYKSLIQSADSVAVLLNTLNDVPKDLLGDPELLKVSADRIDDFNDTALASWMVKQIDSNFSHALAKTYSQYDVVPKTARAKQLDQWLKQHPRSDLWCFYGELCLDMQLVGEAKLAFESALKCDNLTSPDASMAYFGLAKVALEEGDQDAALKTFLQASKQY